MTGRTVTKGRITISVDAALLHLMQERVASGSVSSYVENAIREKLGKLLLEEALTLRRKALDPLSDNS